MGLVLITTRRGRVNGSPGRQFVVACVRNTPEETMNCIPANSTQTIVSPRGALSETTVR